MPIKAQDVLYGLTHGSALITFSKSCLTMNVTRLSSVVLAKEGALMACSRACSWRGDSVMLRIA